MCILDTQTAAVRGNFMKNSWRKLLILMVSLMMGVTLGACSEDEEPEGGNGTADVCNDECTGDNEVCNETTEACECDAGYEYDGNDICVPENGNGTTDACNDECTGDNEVCNETTEACECDTGYEYDGNDTCVPEALPDYPRLHDSIVEPAGMNCEYGGTALRTGLDANENGTLDEDEVDGVNLLCDQHPNSPNPAFLVDIETLPSGDATCPDGGTITHSGYDASEDGILDSNEIESSVTQCNTNACDGTSPLITEVIDTEQPGYGSYDVGDVKAVTIHLSRELDASSANVSQFGEAFAPTADFDWEIDASDASILTIQWIVTDQWHHTKVSISDACGLTIPQVSLPAGNAGPKTRAYTTTDPIVVGEDIEICWESRMTVSCEMDTGTFQNPDVSPLPGTEGCIDVPVEASDISHDMYLGPKITCSNADSAYYPANVNVPMTPVLQVFYNSGLNVLPAIGGQINLTWDTSKMDTCELSFNGQATTVPVNADIYPLYVTESGQFTLECTDADDEAYHAEHPVLVAVGQGFTNANVHPIQDQGGNVHVSFSLNSNYMTDSTCDGTLTYNGDTVSLDLPAWNVAAPPQDHIAGFNYNETLSDVTFVAGSDAALSVTCTTADASFSQTFTHTY